MGPSTGRHGGRQQRWRSVACLADRKYPAHQTRPERAIDHSRCGGFRSVNVRLREEFGFYANLRPVKTLVRGGRYEDIDLVLIRENIEGLYVAFEHFIAVGDDPQAVAISSGVNTHAEARRSVRFAFRTVEDSIAFGGRSNDVAETSASRWL